jgi:hypothetical protein
MAQQDTTPKAVTQVGKDRTEFLRGLNADGYECSLPAIGQAKVDTGVCVFDENEGTNQVMLVLRSGAFALHNMLSAEEARTLAEAISAAASYAVSLNLQKTHAMWASTPADEVTA